MRSKNDPNRIEPWTLGQLWIELQNDLKQCQTEGERINCAAIGKREIREKAIEFGRERKLTPGEESILADL